MSKYVTVQIDRQELRWGVGELHQPHGAWWVEVVRAGLRLEDARDLCDLWNARGSEKRP